MKMSNDDLFASKAITREVIRSRRHLDLLRDYGPKLRDWLARFQSITGSSASSPLWPLTDFRSAVSFSHRSVNGIRICT